MTFDPGNDSVSSPGRQQQAADDWGSKTKLRKSGSSGANEGILDVRQKPTTTRLKRGGKDVTRAYLLRQFADKLYRAMSAQDMSASDLARKLFGETFNSEGHSVAKGRDRVHHWLKGRQLPDNANLERLAQVLMMEADDLVPRPEPVDKGTPDNSFAFTTVPGYPDRVHVSIDKVLDLETAQKIMALLAAQTA